MLLFRFADSSCSRNFIPWIGLLLPLLALPLTSQTSIKTYIQQIANGWTNDAKKALPDLLIDRPDDAAVMFLHASLVDEPKKAQPLLERIFQQYSSSEWADDALLRLVVTSVIQRDSVKAKAYFKIMRDQYGQSDLLPIAYNALSAAFVVPVPATTAAQASPVAQKKPDTPTPTVAVKYTMATLGTADKAAAQKMVNTFKKSRMKVFLTDTKIGSTMQYTVQVGEYLSEPEALKELKTVSDLCKCKPTIVQR
ncbi:MAG: hypothetical protein HYX66_08560 [Ignavibacteria bacterium]|nr:hypothetical protein [Ignavibacteria bacterium]